MSGHRKQALQAALIFSALQTLCIAVMIGYPSAMLATFVFSFITTFVFWWFAFPFNTSKPLFIRATWVGALIPLFFIMGGVLYGRDWSDSGIFTNGGSVAYLLVMFFGALFIPGSICITLAIRWVQTRKMGEDSSGYSDTSPDKKFLIGLGHFAVFVFVLFVASQTLLYLTDDYVGQEEEKRMKAMGYQFKADIENYHKDNSVYPETLDKLPTGQTDHFIVYRKWGAFAYQADGNRGYRLLWRYKPSRGIICSTDLGFWPGAASMRTEDKPPPSLNQYGCYAVNPEEIRKPPWIQ